MKRYVVGLIAVLVIAGLWAVVSLDDLARAQSRCASQGAVDPGETALVADCEVLLDIRDTLAGTSTLNWAADTPIGDWDGISVGGTPQRVVSIVLKDSELNGTIPSQLGNLDSLTELNLAINQLTGGIPIELGKLSRLRSLGFHDNELSGELPPELGQLVNLRWMALSSNQLNGKVPPELGNLRNLDVLGLDENELSGELPSELGLLVNLVWMALSNNQLSGELPSELTKLIQLQEFHFGNNLDLCAPDNAEFQTWLQGMDRWDGVICLPPATPAEKAASRTALVALYNSTEGAERWFNNENWLSDKPIGEWYGIRTNGGHVTEVRLRDNGLRGELPEEVRMLTRLEVLDLSSNEIVGTLPSWIGELSSLRRLLLNRNVFTGELPPELGSLSNLEDLTLDGSAGFFGKLPEALTRLDKLDQLTFYRTALCVPLDDVFQTWLDGISYWRGWDCPPGAGGLPIPTEVPYPVLTREQGYGYTIDIPEDWVDRGNYFDSVPHGRLFVLEHHLHTETTLEQFAESVRDNLKRQFSTTAAVFDITSFEKRQSGGQDSYILKYRLRENADYCVEDIAEQIALGSSLSGPPKGYRLRHRVCASDLSTQLDRARRETLDSLRIVTIADAYYKQFISRPGVLIKAPGKVDPEALKKAAEILDVMLDGRADIPDCLGRIGSALAIAADGDPLNALPEHAHRTSRGASSLHAPGAGGIPHSPVSVTPEQMLRGFDGYPPFRDVHEPGHHVQLCFTESDNRKWVDLYANAVERVGTIEDPIDRLIDHNNLEFWAGFTSFYFHRHYAPRRYAEHLYPEAFAFMQSIYGKLTPTESEHPGYTQYVTASGYKLPWLVPGDVTYQNGTFGYGIDLLQGWVVKKESTDELLLVSRNWPWPEIRIEYTRLPGGANPDDALVDLAESRRLDWQQRTRDWHSSEVKTFERRSLDGSDTYWIHFYGQESSGGCELDIIERVLVASHGVDNYGVVLEGSARCEGNSYSLQDFETMLGSFTLPTTTGAPTVIVSATGAYTVRIDSPVLVTATFSEPVNGFTIDDITVANGDVGNFSGSDGDSVFTFDVTPNAVGVVTVDIAANVAQDSDSDGNAAATQLTLGLPYDDDHDGAIGGNEVLMAVRDYFADTLSPQHVLQVVRLYFQSSS